MADWHIAQVNIGRAIADVDSPELADFATNLDRINALADEAPGFVWRLQSEQGNATDITVSEDPRFIMNLSVWETVEALFDFVYRTAHTKIMARRREWFEHPTLAYQALWWVPAGHIPAAHEALAKLAILDRLGPTPTAFTFKKQFLPPDADDRTPDDMKPDTYCVGLS